MKREIKNFWVYVGGAISVLLILYCLIYIYNYYSANDILWHYPKNTSAEAKPLAPNEIGDSIGGILNPIIGLVASILTFLAFYMQKKANDDIREQFRVQQFESQFYEMLRLHKENVNEMNVEFTIWDEDFENPKLVKADKRQVFKEMNDFFYKILEQSFLFGEFTQTEFEAAYKLFFWGYNKHYYDILRRNNAPITNVNDQTDNLFTLIHNHNGYAYILAHYFRHLFLMVKFVDRNTIVTDHDERMKYLKILRAQLSNQEQILLFYNWLCEDYGSAWQEEDEKGNKFFTGYKMIHNLWHKELYPDNFFYREINDLIEEYNKKLQDTPLFEFQGKNPKYLLPINEAKPLADKF